MKRNIQRTIILLFMAALWLPLLCTPWICGQERGAMAAAERRRPNGTLSLKECGGDVKQWAGEVQLWFRDSFAFRSKLMAFYHTTHYLVHNYPEKIYGRGGYMILKAPVGGKLRPLPAVRREKIKRNLENLRQLCTETDTPCLFILIPSKTTVHPELAPSWLRGRLSGSNRHELVALIRTNGFPLLDLSLTLRKTAKKNGEVLFRKYDHHWNIAGALAGYREMIPAIKEFIPRVRMVTEKNYSLKMDDHDARYARRFYLGRVFDEPLLDRMEGVNLPPVRVVREGRRDEECVLYMVYRGGRTDVFCRDQDSSTVVFIRDSFLDIPSSLLSYGVAHSIYLNNSKEGRHPGKVMKADHPDLLVIALEEDLMAKYLTRMK